MSHSGEWGGVCAGSVPALGGLTRTPRLGAVASRAPYLGLVIYGFVAGPRNLVSEWGMVPSWEDHGMTPDL